MEYKDYYKILGIGKTATEEEIRKAFKKLALKYHPDKNPGNTAAEDMFKQINEAKEVLVNAENRFLYDQLGERFKQSQRMKQQPKPSARNPMPDIEDADLNMGFGRFFEEIFGGGNSRRGKDQQANVKITLEEAYRGMSDVLGFEGKKLRIHIKPGIKDQQVLRLKGQGELSKKGGDPGDLYMTVIIKPHSMFTRKENDLYTSVNVDLYTAVLGKKVPVQTMKGQMFMSVPKGTQQGEVLKLRDLGMPDYENPQVFGNLYVTVNVKIPKTLSPQERDLFEQLDRMKKR
ncbi:MAG: J domain-containing protein [Bacteroidia bacterium]